MGIYVGRSTSHAFNVGLILNLRTGHVSPQFHEIYVDNLSVVSYLCTVAVPTHGAKLAKASYILEVYTEQQVGTWQSLPD
jgi:hypothetical protein